MELTLFKRKGTNKSEVNQIRREGNIPAVIYAPGKESESVYIQGAELQSILQKLRPGRLATTIFELKDGEKKMRAIVKDVQYHLTSYVILHMDFELISDDLSINVNVPIEMIHVADCAGVKQGGVLRQVIRTLRVKCLPKDLPSDFEINVKDLKLGHNLRLSAIDLPKKVQPLVDLKQVAVLVGKR